MNNNYMEASAALLVKNGGCHFRCDMLCACGILCHKTKKFVYVLEINFSLRIVVSANKPTGKCVLLKMLETFIALKFRDPQAVFILTSETCMYLSIDSIFFDDAVGGCLFIANDYKNTM